MCNIIFVIHDCHCHCSFQIRVLNLGSCIHILHLIFLPTIHLLHSCHIPIIDVCVIYHQSHQTPASILYNNIMTGYRRCICICHSVLS